MMECETGIAFFTQSVTSKACSLIMILKEADDEGWCLLCSVMFSVHCSAQLCWHGMAFHKYCCGRIQQEKVISLELSHSYISTANYAHPTASNESEMTRRDEMEWNTSLQQNTPAPTHSQAAAHAFSSIKSIGMPIDCSFFFIKHKSESGNYSKIIGFLPSQFSIHTNNSNSSSINQDTCAHANVWVGL